MTDAEEPPAPRIAVSPENPNLDTELHIRLTGLPPGAEVTLRASLRDPRGGTWASEAAFAADRLGVVDLRRDAPLRGTYQDADPMGPIWSMEPAQPPEPGAAADLLSPTPLSLAAEVGGTEVAAVRVERRRVPDGLKRTDVRERGLVGTLYCPPGDEPVPGVLMLGGSEGGMHEDDAALLAGHGFAVMALAYYGLAGLPPTLQDIPLEYFGAGLDYLADHGRVRSDRLAITGGSKGGEAALLAATVYPQVRAAISVVGGGLVTMGISQSIASGSFLEIMKTPVANWTYQGRALPYLPNVVTPELEALVAAGEPVELRMAFDPMTELAEQRPETVIPVERIRGAVLLISADEDRSGALAFHDIPAKRLAASGHPYPWKHVVYEGAGHGIAAPPYAPTTQSLWPGPGVVFRTGGTPAATARGRAGAWREVREFLTQALAD
ncbi:MAG TPA: acyl-CoA thioester hydrolase/BAAT C-terminal domain-containing protein [Actinocrinis sp.]|jgi:dienelactone hydrolase